MLDRISSLAISCAVLLALLASGCGPRLIPFTHEIRFQQHLSNEDLKNLQYYVSHRITLRRELESGGSQVTGNHKLRVVSGKTVEDVVIEEHTPGIAVAITDRSITLSFEPGSSIRFSVGSELDPEEQPASQFASPPNPFPGNSSPPVPQLFPTPSGGETFGGSYWIALGPGSRLNYLGRQFTAIEESLQAHLLIDAESLEEEVESRKVLPGMRLPSK